MDRQASPGNDSQSGAANDVEGGRWVSACAIADVTEEVAKKVDIEGSPSVAVFKVDGQFYAIADLCTHGQASLSEGFVDNGIVECPFHSGTFDIKTGRALTFPCTEAVYSYPVRVVSGEIQIRLDSPVSR